MRRKTISYDCKIFYCDKYHGSEVQNELDRLKKDGWKKRRHYFEVTSNGNKVTFEQEVYWFDQNARCHIGDADYRHHIYRINDFDDVSLSHLASSIAKEMTDKHGHLGKGALRSVRKKGSIRGKYNCHLYILIKKIEK